MRARFRRVYIRAARAMSPEGMASVMPMIWWTAIASRMAQLLRNPKLWA